MNRIKKVSRPAASLLALLLCMTLFASTAFAAGGGLGADRNGTPYTYVIGYMYSGSSQKQIQKANKPSIHKRLAAYRAMKIGRAHV